jgi:hypothetical protein
MSIKNDTDKKKFKMAALDKTLSDSSKQFKKV